MDVVYSPWRSSYFSQKSDGCIFCEISKEESMDVQNRVIYRDEVCYVVMNRFPYTPGHILIIPHKHIDSPELLGEDEWLHMHKLSQKSFNMLYDYGASGINMGLNIKMAGGAGIPEHLHIHLLPRWIGDTNFFTSVCDSRSFGCEFDDIYKRMLELSKKHLIV